MRGVLIALVAGPLGCGRVGFDARATGDSGTDGDAPDGSLPVASCTPPVPTGTVIHVDAVAGDDARNGTAGNPVRTITRGIALAPAGSTVLVQPGDYSAEPGSEVQFDSRQDVALISAQRYRARFPRIECFDCDGLVVDGFEIAGSAGVCAQVSFGKNVTFRDNIIHDCGSAAVRIAGDVTGAAVVGNVIYDSRNALVHLNDNAQADVVDNVIFDTAPQGTYAAIWLEGSTNTVVARNVLFHSQHESATYGTISIGIAQNLLVENNFVGPNDAGADRGGAVGLDDAAGTATIRFNTFMGPLPGATFAITRNAGVTMPSTFTVTHNVWWTPAMTSQPFSTASETGSDGFTLDRNVYYNGSGTFLEPGLALGPSDDPRALAVEPQIALGSAAPPAPPVWSQTMGFFADGSPTTCEVRTKLIAALGAIPVTSPVAGRSLIAPPATDIRGKPRPTPAALGAYEP